MDRQDSLQRRSNRRNVKPPSKYQERADAESGSEDDQPGDSSQGQSSGQLGRRRSAQVRPCPFASAEQMSARSRRAKTTAPRDLRIRQSNS